MTTRLAAAQPQTNTLDACRTLFYHDVADRRGISRREAEQALEVLDQLIARNPARLVFMPNDPKQEKKQSLVRFGLAAAGPVVWTAQPGPVFGAKLIVLPKITEDLEAERETIRNLFNEIDHGTWRKAHPDDLVPTIEFRFLRFPRDFERVVQGIEAVVNVI